MAKLVADKNSPFIPYKIWDEMAPFKFPKKTIGGVRLTNTLLPTVWVNAPKEEVELDEEQETASTGEASHYNDDDTDVVPYSDYIDSTEEEEIISEVEDELGTTTPIEDGDSLPPYQFIKVEVV